MLTGVGCWAVFYITASLGCTAMLIIGIIFLVHGGDRETQGLILLLVGILAPFFLACIHGLLTACIEIKCHMEDKKRRQKSDEFHKNTVPTRVVTSLNLAPPSTPSTPPALPLTEQQEPELSSL